MLNINKGNHNQQGAEEVNDQALPAQTKPDPDQEKNHSGQDLNDQDSNWYALPTITAAPTEEDIAQYRYEIIWRDPFLAFRAVGWGIDNRFLVWQTVDADIKKTAYNKPYDPNQPA
jgi:hypothetical protein